jgi:Protein of unknown function (DUF559)
VGRGSQILYEIIRDLTWLPPPRWEDRWMVEWNDQSLSTTPDCSYWSEKIAIYIDGSHHMQMLQADQDRLRRNWLLWAGFLVLTYSNLRLDFNPSGVAAELQAAWRWRHHEMKTQWRQTG